MDRIRKGLLLGLGFVIGAALLWIVLTLHRDTVKRMESQLLQYEEQMAKLNDIGGNLEELQTMKDYWQAELDNIEQTNHPERFNDIYDFSSSLLTLLEQSNIEVENYRFMDVENRQLLEIQYKASGSSLFRILEIISDEHPSWYIQDMSVHRGRDSVTGIIRIGYE